MRPEEQLRQARDAELLYEHPLIQQFFHDMDLLLLEQLAQTEVKDVEARERIHGLLIARRSFAHLFRIFIDRGKVVAADLRAQEDWRKRHKG